MNVCVVWHVHHFDLSAGVNHRDEGGQVINLDANEDLKVIGIYCSELLAGEAVERARLLDGFRDEPDCFIVDEYKVDEDKWTDGFVTVCRPARGRRMINKNLAGPALCKYRLGGFRFAPAP
jgi:hypothetical protein